LHLPVRGEDFAPHNTVIRMRAPDVLDLLTVAAAVSTLAVGACRANVDGQEPSNAASAQSMTPSSTPREPARPIPAVQTRGENDMERAVHAELDRAFALDANLKDQAISFTVDSGDVTLTGSVRTVKQREKANEVAMNVPGVRSVANVLRVSP
jgi:osmotically-inducible protein OsmY